MKVGQGIAAGVIILALASAAIADAAQPGGADQAAPAPAKQIVRTQDDLPRHHYPLSGSAADLIAADDATFNAWAERVAANVDATLARYDIQDAGTRRRLLTMRMAVDLLNGSNAAALDAILAVRALEQKPDQKLTSGLLAETILRARLETGASAGPAFEGSYARQLRSALAKLPWQQVSTSLKELKSGIEFQTPTMIAGYVATEVEPAVAKAGGLSDAGADDVLWARTANRVFWPVAKASIAALREVIAANQAQKPDIWAARELTLGNARSLTPVIAAVWDSGVDTALFKGRLYTPARRPPRGPGNGHGISFDIDSKPTDGVLLPLTKEQADAYPTVVADFQGFSDNQAAIDSPAAERLRAKLAAMPAAEAPRYLTQMRFFGDYYHGTHVAGILARGNPALRLAVIRDTYDTNPVPITPTDATVSARIESFRDISAWLGANNVRVVNMSWIDTPGGYERALEKNGIGKDQAERKAMARRYFERSRDAFVALLAANPKTLFVSAAGNSDSDNGFEEGYPSAIVAPNLIIASAVDQAGEETSFTSNGRNVAVSANGYHVLSWVPGGQQLAESGTSMASPNVANLAAKLIAIRPSLTPEQVIKLIKDGATPSSDGRRRTINPKASAELLKAGKY